jgi:hypothetical protein
MTLFRALPAVVIAMSALAMGCVDGGDDLEESDAPETDAPFSSPLGTIAGSTGTNNLNPLDLHNNKDNLFGATQAALATYVANDQTWWLANNAPDNALLGSTGGRSVLKYAVRCTLLSSSTVNAQLGSTVFSYPGQGLLATASAWKTTALTPDQTDDLFTCLLAHLNANGVSVPINLSGPHVTNAAGFDPSFNWEEALWAAKLVQDDDGGTVFNFYVWPRSVAGCPNYAAELASRVCGTFTGSCGLTVRSDFATACTETAAGWYCNDATGHALPAILTRLKLGDVKKLYTGCI